MSSTDRNDKEKHTKDILSEKPFLGVHFDAYSEDAGLEFTENLENENPFCDEFSIFPENQPIPKGRQLQNWSREAFQLKKTNTLVRSTPQSVGCSFWSHRNSGEQITLPTLGCGRSDAIKRISAQTLVCLMNKTFDREYLLVDARFRYEYEGGHIRGAVNLNSEEEMFKNIKKEWIVIFYCEFSSIRGPTLARRLRNKDRMKNKYPSLDFPEIYVLEGGYRNFFCEFPQLCIPRSYVRMHDKRFSQECAYFHRKKIKKS